VGRRAWQGKAADLHAVLSGPIICAIVLIHRFFQVLAKKILPDLLQTTGPLQSKHDASTTGLLMQIRSLRSSSVLPITGSGGQSAILMTTPDGSSATVYLQGAHVTSYRGPDHVERIFTSSQSNFAPGKAIRGGIPLCFPQFSNRGPLPSHGFFRTSEWKVVSSKTDSSACSVILSLGSTEATMKVWPHEFEATCTVSLNPVQGSSSLTVDVAIQNKSSNAMSVSGALHSYFRVGSIERSKVMLHARDYEDNLAAGAVCSAESAVAFACEVDRV
jgi:glucose-6-phosphate 1-epimerase